MVKIRSRIILGICLSGIMIGIIVDRLFQIKVLKYLKGDWIVQLAQKQDYLNYLNCYVKSRIIHIRKMTTQNPISLFLSYASDDYDKVLPFYYSLKDEGFSVWMDKMNLLAGQLWDSAIRKAIRESDLFLVFLTNNSVNKRGYLQKEIRIALDLWEEKLHDDIYIMPIRLEECEIPELLKKFHCIDFLNSVEVNEKSKNYKNLLQSINTEAKKLGKETSNLDLSYRIIKKKIQEEINDDDISYFIEVEYPNVENIENKDFSYINNYLSRLAINSVNAFRNDIEEMSKTDKSRLQL